ncbi:hypothetical protein QKW35_16485 [Pontibacterium granulatum]|uniref:hypothetical protein n=1 Tax=Pontibacterium granulatum TaxID=2036029 RepID=UPI00249BE4F4|nr:hypothetical protein [Pontibacterium granulatum]MDI3325978.1 hypothetical protein [Pontibacterium granulatum]
MADFIGHKADYALETWEKERRLPSETEVIAALEHVNSALGWTPDNPELLELKALLLSQKGFVRWSSGEFKAITDEAIPLYLKAVALRPKWPHTWANFALLKAHRGEFDAQYKEAIEQSVSLGPWEPGVHRVITDAGLYGWGHIDTDTRRLVAANIHRGLLHGKRSVQAVAKRHNKTLLVCGYLPRDKQTIRFCGW